MFSDGDLMKNTYALIQLDTEQDLDIASLRNGTIGLDSSYFKVPESFSMIEASIPKLLDLAEKSEIKYVFFTSGKVAAAKSSLIRRVAEQGHEVGVHTHPYNHPLYKCERPDQHLYADRLPLYSFKDQFRMVQKDLEMIKNHVGVNPISFKAGANSVGEETLVALDKLGFEVDCSLWENIFGFLSRKRSLPAVFSSARIVGNTSLIEIVGGIDERAVFNPKFFGVKLRELLNRLGGKTKLVVISLHTMIFGNNQKISNRCWENFSDIVRTLDRENIQTITPRQVAVNSELINSCQNAEESFVAPHLKLQMAPFRQKTLYTLSRLGPSATKLMRWIYTTRRAHVEFMESTKRRQT
jgi:hypothetical protein